MDGTNATLVEHDGLGLVVHVHEPAGDGAGHDLPVLALHGFPQTHRCWDAVVAGLVAEDRRVLVPELRGYSPTARPLDDPAYALDRVVADVVAVLDHAGLEQVDLLGHDWGAVTAWAVAAAHPDRVRSLVAVSVPHPHAFAAAIDRDADQQARSAYLRLFRQSGPDHGHRAEEVLLADDARRLRATFAPLPADLVELHTAALRDRDTLTGALGWYRAMDRDELLAVPAVTVPTTFVWGAEDVAIGRVAATACADRVAAPYRFLALDGVSHWVPEQAPEVLIGAVRHPPTSDEDRAEKLAAFAHHGQTDKNGVDYLEHPRGVVGLLRRSDLFAALAPHEQAVAVEAAWLHDTVEDSAVTADDLRRFGFDEHVVQAVVLLTRTADVAPDDYYRAIRPHRVALAVKVADIAHNTLPSRRAGLDPATADRLAGKYDKGLGLLGVTGPLPGHPAATGTPPES